MLTAFSSECPLTQIPQIATKMTAKTVKTTKHLQNYQIKLHPFLIVEKTWQKQPILLRR